MASESSECTVKVFCRFRPQNALELATNGRMVAKFGGTNGVSHHGKVFQFDRVFQPETTQETVYKETSQAIVQDVLNGYNGTVFAYGQTSSGKTHTMEGVIDHPELQGIIPRIIDGIFQYIYNMEEGVEFHIKVSYFEIYMERIRDLLDVSKTNLAIHEDKNRVTFVKGVTERFVSSPEEILAVIEEGKANRHVAVTNMNEHSSRSHSVFQIHVRQDNLGSRKKLIGKLYLVDLAGSEKVSKSGADGLVLEEAKNINKSLSALGNVISALADGHKTHVPYRDSKLTRILQESLGGNAQTTVIICCSPSSTNETETRGTLLFGQRAKTIKNTVVINEELSAEEWRLRFEKERAKNGQLSLALKKLEAELNRWRKGERVNSKEQFDWNSDGKEEVSPKSLAVSEREKFEGEIQTLFSQLDEKDEEISSGVQRIDQLMVELEEMKESADSLQREKEKLMDQLASAQEGSDKGKEEVQEMMQALEDLAINYDVKSQTADSKTKENENLVKERDALREAVSDMKKKVGQAETMVVFHQKKAAEMIASLHEELLGLGSLLGPEVDDLHPPDPSKTDEEFTRLRLYLSQTKTVVAEVVTTKESLQAAQESSGSKVENVEAELAKTRLLLSQNETKVKTLTDSLVKTETKKREVTESFDELSEELSQLKAQKKVRDAATYDREKEKEQAVLIRGALEEERDIHREAHHKQITTLRGDNQQLEERLKNLQEDVQQKDAALALLKVEYEKQGDVLKDRSVELERVRVEIVSREKAKKELNALEETVSKELQTLAKLRRDVYQDIQSRIKSESSNVPSSDESQKIAFLESNLDRLTQVHKQLVQDNNDFRRDYPKLERRLASKNERIKQLEAAIRDIKTTAQKEKQRLSADLERLKSVYDMRMKRSRNVTRQANIAKPIRPGQQYAKVIPVVRSGPLPATNDPWRPIPSSTTSSTGRTNPFYSGRQSGSGFVNGSAANGPLQSNEGTPRRHLPVVTMKDAVYVVDVPKHREPASTAAGGDVPRRGSQKQNYF